MADAAVEFLLNNVQQLLLHQVHLISDAKNQVEKLEKDLCLFNAFLRDATKKSRKTERLRVVVGMIRDVVYEAEDVIDAFVTQAAVANAKNFILRAFQKPVNLLDIAGKVEEVGLKVRDIIGDKNRIEFASANLSLGDGEFDELEAPVIRQHNVVGFEDEVEKITGFLNEKTEKLDIISIIGMPGLGKTTLTSKIFWDTRMQYEYPTRIWVYVSQDFTTKDIFLTILREFTQNITDDIYRKTDQELAHLVSSYLATGKFLIVMDDVWTAEDWEKLQIAFPRNNYNGKILITSRNVEVARYANRNREPHRLRFLTAQESWLLLKLEVFGNSVCPHQELEIFGNIIVKHCRGLPLAIVVIGGILVKKFLVSDEASVKNAWKKVSENVNAYLNEEDPERRMEKIIALSYDKLPHHLRACFLYFGIFPEDFEVSVWKLIRMWIAEGFIQQKDGSNLEETAEGYLDDLINRNLVKVEKIKSNGRAKTCRMHDMLRDFCKAEAGRENFLKEIKRSSDGDFEPKVSEVHKYRRLCIHTNVLTFLSSKPYGLHVRSFACFSKEEISLPAQNVSDIPAAFKLLRVLEANTIKFSKIPSDIYQLIHLRYITLSFSLAVLPKNFSKLWNLQTLVVDTSCRTLEVKADIWNMLQLRHLKTNASAILPKSSEIGKQGGKLQTLGLISPKSCTVEVFNRASNLKKLGIRGHLSSLLEGKSASFDNLVKISSLEKLNLVNDVFPLPASEGHLPRLPQHYKFPPKLKSLTLSETSLDWGQMSTLGLLDNLQVLKLKEKAFMGKSWETNDGGFRRLEFLHMGRTDLIMWVASGHHFPKLKRLELINCEDLVGIPIGLADIPSFHVLNLYLSSSAASSARKICDAVKGKRGEQSGTAGGFKLTIFPTDESSA